MAKRAQRQRDEPELVFELRKIGYLEHGLADLPGQAADAFPALLGLLRRAGDIGSDAAAPLAAASATVREAVDEVASLNERAGTVLTVLLALEPSVAHESSVLRYDVAASALGKQFERGTGPGSRRHAFALLAARLERRARPTSAPLVAKFVTLDDPSIPNARDIVPYLSELRVRTRSGAALLTGYKALIQEMLARGGRLRLLTLCPGSPAADRAYGSAPVLFDANRAVAATIVQQIVEAVPAAAIHWRQTSEPASISQVIAVRDGAPAVSLVQINLVYAMHGRERPVVVLGEDDQWFPSFAEEFEYIWRFRSEERSE